MLGGCDSTEQVSRTSLPIRAPTTFIVAVTSGGTVLFAIKSIQVSSESDSESDSQTRSQRVLCDVGVAVVVVVDVELIKK